MNHDHEPEANRKARVVDLETTGTPEDADAEIIEIGTIDVDLVTLTTFGEWQQLCRPRGPIPAVTKAVHHITETDVADAPECREIFEGIFEDMNEGDYLVAHNAKFEQHFIGRPGQRWIDTYKVARVVWPDAPTHSNQGLRYWLELPVDRDRASPPHRALPDAYVTACIFVRLLDEKTPEQMAHISQYPALLKIMNFGKHKGMTFEEAPGDYLEWIRDKSDMDEDTKFTAKYWLQKRNAA